MSPILAVGVFLASATLTLLAAAFFADKLDHIGPKLGLPEAVVGLLTAAAADAPEISSALIALSRGEKQVGLGVVLGSNVFNLAAMIGVSAVFAGAVTLRREALLAEGAFALVATALAGALVVGALPAWLALALFAAALAPYLFVIVHRTEERIAAPRPPANKRDGSATWRPASLLLPAVALIVAGSFGMVRSALVLAGTWHVPKVVVGIVVLAVLTSLPNAFTAVRLGLSGRGAALVSETLGSNTINLVGGILIPALFVGVARGSHSVDFDLGWLIGMTVLTVALLSRPRGLGSRGGLVLIALYAVFIVVQIAVA